MSGERELQLAGVELLRKAGFVVKVFSQHRPTTRQVADFPDVVAFCNNKTLLVEFKARGGKLRPGQAAFAQQIDKMLGQHLVYAVVDDIDQLSAIIVMMVTDYDDLKEDAGARDVMRSEDAELDVARGGQ